MIRRTTASLAALTALALAGQAHADAVQLYYERAVMVSADTRCHLFSSDLASALQAATAQAHGAALRSGAADTTLDAVAQRAQSRVSQVGCNSSDIATAATRVRTAFDGYAKLQKMDYPGDTAAWRAQRSSPMQYAVWKLSQTTRMSNGGSAVLGLAGRSGPSDLLAVANFADGRSPYTARLVVRNRALAPQPFLNAIRSTSSVLPLASRMPPASAMTAFLPEARGEADPLLRPQGARSAASFRFPKTATQALSGLDPREAVAVQFVFMGARGDEVRTAYFEVGDFAAGRAFLAANQR